MAGLERYLLALGMISDVAAEKSQSRGALVSLITSCAPLPWGEAAEKATGKGELGDKNIPRASLIHSQQGPCALLTVPEVCRWCAGVQRSDEMAREGSRDTHRKDVSEQAKSS